ncbi:alpha/beta hydrolase [Azorhizobium oxalatiphilum]|uniref:Alpha/beta hydrolase n=1 Tax=Azorhizobium oxalatiphilum TaxID=980631 RepID=A0A917BRR8_9HYPH|nr:alpha/beta hydrolase [Azorhizobium oxalatiphilum]GGF53601.1 alpha/beta hydrolase [Azorhizobium oxalatiphilum]
MRATRLAALLLTLATPAAAQTPASQPPAAQPAGAPTQGAPQAGPAVRPYGLELQEFDYPHAVQRFEFVSQRKALHMAYMDVKPEQPNGRTVVLLHGKNFCGATWESVIAPLVKAGYRVVAPDQVGFCKSSKPLGYQFSLHQLAANTKALLDQIGVEKPIVMGHSMGGMLAMRYALSFPDALSGLVLVNPIGLEDWRAAGIPSRTVDQWYAGELRTNFDGIKAYQQRTYYAGHWAPDYDRWVAMLAGMYMGEGKAAVAWDQALTSDMVYSQPVVYELGHIRAPTLLLIGEKDNTAIGKDMAPPDVQKKVGNYAKLGPETAKAIPNAKLVAFPDLGHAPQIQAPDRFNEALLKGLGDLK